MTDEIDWTAWHADGHQLDARVSVWRGKPLPAAPPRRPLGQLEVTVECPEDSVCRRTDTVDYCFVRDNMQDVGFIDFIEMMNALDVPEDWSSRFPVVIEWRDQGEDGVEWRPTTEGEKGG